MYIRFLDPIESRIFWACRGVRRWGKMAACPSGRQDRPNENPVCPRDGPGAGDDDPDRHGDLNRQRMSSGVDEDFQRARGRLSSAPSSAGNLLLQSHLPVFAVVPAGTRRKGIPVGAGSVASGDRSRSRKRNGGKTGKSSMVT